MSTDPADGRAVEDGPSACPSCRAPWPLGTSGRVRVGFEHCQCSGARFGGHRTWLCWSCGVDHFDAPCDQLDGRAKRHPDTRT